jgi:hypothetical protein
LFSLRFGMGKILVAKASLTAKWVSPIPGEEERVEGAVGPDLPGPPAGPARPEAERVPARTCPEPATCPWEDPPPAAPTPEQEQVPGSSRWDERRCRQLPRSRTRWPGWRPPTDSKGRVRPGWPAPPAGSAWRRDVCTRNGSAHQPEPSRRSEVPTHAAFVRNLGPN